MALEAGIDAVIPNSGHPFTAARARLQPAFPRWRARSFSGLRKAGGRRSLAWFSTTLIVNAIPPASFDHAAAEAALVLPGTPPAGGGFVAQMRDLVARLPGGRPSWDEYFMATALLISSRSPCDRLHVGCILVSGGEHQNRIVAAGYNGFLPGAPHQSRVRDGHEQATVHAEQNAITDAARRGISVNGATAYITHFPCVNCAKLLAAAGVRLLKYHLDYRNDPLVRELAREWGVELVQL